MADSNRTYPCPGIRVVRGPDWSGHDQDGGEGHVGTVVRVERPKGRVTVVWDSGRELQYLAGLNNKFELLVFDSGPAGVAQTGFTCDACGETPIVGIRWKCAECTDFDLCTLCYNTEKHDLSHAFLRCLTNNSPIVKLSPRKDARRTRAVGLFKEATVMRGPHWKYGNQDGGEGNVGEIIKLGAWTGGFARGGVNVRWSGKTDSLKGYRCGAQGLVEIIAAIESQGWRYYKAHLPVLDVQTEGIRLKLGDKVKVSCDEKVFERLHKDIAGFRESMRQCMDEVGTIVKLTDDRDDRVVVAQYPDADKYLLVKSSLKQLHSFSVGDRVKIISNYNAAVELQTGHGGWNDKMEDCLGKEGEVIDIDKDGDLKVEFGKRRWFFSPVSCVPMGRRKSVHAQSPGPTAPPKQAPTLPDGMDMAEGISKLLFALMRVDHSMRSVKGNLMKAVGDNDVQQVKQLLPGIGKKIDEAEGNVTPLQLACYKGYEEVTKCLLTASADVNVQDGDGDTPLHYAVTNDHPHIVKVLLKARAASKRRNQKGLTPLHLSVAMGNPSVDCLLVMIEAKCDPNTQDNDGDTPLHDAIRNGIKPVLDAFLKSSSLNLRLCDSEGRNPFHLACSELDGSTTFPQALIKMDPAIVNVPITNIGLTPLHIAAMNGFLLLAGVLLKAKCDVNAVDINGKSALHLTVHSCHLQIVQLLLDSGAAINCQDKEGNTPLHCAHMDQSLFESSNRNEDVAVEVRCCLALNGGRISIKNGEGKTPLDFIKNPEVRVMLERLAKQAKAGGMAQSTVRRQNGHWVTMKDATVVKIPLDPAEPTMAFEYNTVEEQMGKTLSNMNIISIHRIQNISLWEQYDVAKKKLERQYGKGLANEMRLFHGTTPEAADIIPRQNIDFRLAGDRVGTRYGKGAYFAVDAKYSDVYSKEDSRKHKFMFLAKVLIGKFKRGSPNLKRPPPLNDSDPTQLADSACDDESAPKIYVVFSESQIYPEYLIEYN